MTKKQHGQVLLICGIFMIGVGTYIGFEFEWVGFAQNTIAIGVILSIIGLPMILRKRKS